MAMSIDVDAWCKSDPPRLFELAGALGQGSPFEARHGYYLYPVSPRVATKPKGWKLRLVRIELEPALAPSLTLSHRGWVRMPTPSFRFAAAADLPAIVSLLADDILGAKRERIETPLPPAYLRAFEEIDVDPNNELVVVCLDDRVVGVLQLTFIPGLSNQGARRAQLEGVRVARDLRSQGIGEKLLTWAIDRARARGCGVLQLSTDKRRIDAKRFYERLGFVASHEGMKLMIDRR